MSRSWLKVSLFQSVADWVNNIRFRKYEFMNINDDYALLYKYRGNGRWVTVPAWLRDYYIEELGPALFNNNRRIRSVKIQNGVGTVDKETFEDCVNLRRITFPASVREISGQPFAGCIRLRRIRLKGEDGALYMHKGMLINRLDGRLVFCVNRRCTGIDVPEGVKIISSYAFGNCEQLRRITLPDTLERIDACAFTCSGLDRIRIPAGTSRFECFSLDFGLASQEIEVFPGSPAERFLRDSRSFVKARDLEGGWAVYQRRNRP